LAIAAAGLKHQVCVETAVARWLCNLPAAGVGHVGGAAAQDTPGPGSAVATDLQLLAQLGRAWGLAILLHVAQSCVRLCVMCYRKPQEVVGLLAV
jgi:hypothetical protein